VGSPFLFPIEADGELVDATGGASAVGALMGSESNGEADACAGGALCSRTQ
jgi:hypothetical protein